MNKQYGLAIFLALAVLLSVACGSDPTPTLTPTTAPTAAPTAVPTVAAATNTPVPTATTAPTNTPAPTPVITVPTSTPAPAPTIDLEAAKSSQPPHIFVGTAKIDGVAAPRGTIVSALIGDQIAASGLVGGNGEFTTIKVEIPGYPITFQVGDYPASQPAITTEKGGATKLDLNASRN